jgi:hypothetical protein
MKTKGLLAAGFLVAFCGLSATLMAQKAATAPVAPEKDPDALAALDRMGAYLRGLKAFQVTSRTEHDEVLTDGQKVEFDGTADLLVRGPDRLMARVDSDKKSRIYFYDGKTFTVYLPRMKYYAAAPAPATLGQLIDVLEAKFDVELPLSDLFDWGTDRAATASITSARDIGPSAVDGTSCEHYAFRQDGLDWQIWIQQGVNPLPRKMVLTTLTDEARPQHSSTLTWNLAPAYDDESFTFVPPKDVSKIVLKEYAAGSRGSK